MNIPRALLIGPMKAGTTWAHDYLSWRGDVCLPKGVKETFFFDQHFDRGVYWYNQHFKNCNSSTHRLIVEVAPSLFHCPEAPRRVAEILGPIALIVTTRDPIARAWSHYLHLRRKGYTNLPLADAISVYPEIIAASQYETYIKRWHSFLPSASITTLQMEELATSPKKYAARLCNALGLPELPPPPALGKVNSGGIPPSFFLARWGRQMATLLRSNGCYGTVIAAKHLGLKRLFFGADGGVQPEITETERQLLQSALTNIDR